MAVKEITLKDLKRGQKIIGTRKENGKIDLRSTVIWKIENITDKSIIYTDGEFHRTQYKTIRLKKYSIKQFLKLMNKGWSRGNSKWTYTITK